MPTRAFIEAEWAKKGGTGLPPLAGAAEEKWTVLYNVKEGGNQVPLVGFTKVKVNTASTGAVKEKNKAWNAERTASGEIPVKTAEVQQCYLVTLEAESAEEACLVVDKLLSGGGDPLAASQPSYGPKLGGNNNGKYAACLSANLEEKAII